MQPINIGIVPLGDFISFGCLYLRVGKGMCFNVVNRYTRHLIWELNVLRGNIIYAQALVRYLAHRHRIFFTAPLSDSHNSSTGRGPFLRDDAIILASSNVWPVIAMCS